MTFVPFESAELPTTLDLLPTVMPLPALELLLHPLTVQPSATLIPESSFATARQSINREWSAMLKPRLRLLPALHPRRSTPPVELNPGPELAAAAQFSATPLLSAKP